jgi:hypothetical protein
VKAVLLAGRTESGSAGRWHLVGQSDQRGLLSHLAKCPRAAMGNGTLTAADAMGAPSAAASHVRHARLGRSPVSAGVSGSR